MCGRFCLYFEIDISVSNIFLLFLFYSHCFFPLCFIFVPFLSQADVNCCQKCRTGANICPIKMEPELSFLIMFFSIIKIVFHIELGIIAYKKTVSHVRYYNCTEHTNCKLYTYSEPVVYLIFVVDMKLMR